MGEARGFLHTALGLLRHLMNLLLVVPLHRELSHQGQNWHLFLKAGFKE